MIQFGVLFCRIRRCHYLYPLLAKGKVVFSGASKEQLPDDDDAERRPETSEEGV